MRAHIVTIAVLSLIPKTFTWTSDSLNCTGLSQGVLKEIRGYAPTAKRIIDHVLSGPGRGKTYDDLALFVDKFGHRLTGSESLENSIDYMVDLLERKNLSMVWTENVTVTPWVRGTEVAWMTKPRKKYLNILGLGGSIATGQRGITGRVHVVSTFEELNQTASEACGKIVLLNAPFVKYSETVVYRYQSAAAASRAGALAVLIRSISPFSIDSPHTGIMEYEEGIKKIPAAALSIEDAELIERISKRGETVEVHLYMEAALKSQTVSRNTIADIRGREKPDELVLVSGHLDSWDVGQGAMDDGGGAFISWRALETLRELDLTPRRTLRVVLWTSEEQGLIGAKAYFDAHSKEPYSIVMESDHGTFKPLGLTFSGNSTDAQCIVREVVFLMDSMNATELVEGDTTPDLKYFVEAGVPGAGLHNENDKYFYFHHSQGDTMTVLNSTELDMCTALWTVSSYVFADMSIMLPR
ncbi:carboxypeptidase Q-like [Ornithodoros turicata]|uniref:carboxypeptidase Q-like n=1 Tax=Ornithodoros turicata TaxID=34597 RepID=UPI00313960D0